MKRFLAWLPALLWAAMIFLVSDQPKETFVRLGFTGELLSTTGHFVSYALLMFLVVLALQYGSNLRRKYLFILAFVLIALYGLSDEYHQTFVDGRTATLWDWLVDLSGATLVWIGMASRNFPSKATPS